MQPVIAAIIGTLIILSLLNRKIKKNNQLPAPVQQQQPWRADSMQKSSKQFLLLLSADKWMK